MWSVFWFGFTYGFCMGIAFWCTEVLMKEWRNATQPAAAT